MVWYDHLYMGEKAKRHRFSIIQNIRQKKIRPGIYVITPPSNGNNVLDIYPAAVLFQEYYERQDLLILGIADGRRDALRLAGRIVGEMYEKTGAFRLDDFLQKA